ncbi:MAG: hypothetical protein R2771_03395 [Saprospiraceae bacterium]
MKKTDKKFNEKRFNSMLQARRYLKAKSDNDLKRIYEDFNYFE